MYVIVHIQISCSDRLCVFLVLCLPGLYMMVSRIEFELLIKSQRDSYNDTISHLVTSFESRFSKLESDLINSKLEIADLKRTNEEQKLSIREFAREIENLKDPVLNAEAFQHSTTTRIDYLEDQSRRNNLRFDGVPEDTSENWEQTAKKVQDLVRINLGIQDTIVIERAHRVGKPNHQKPRTIVAKFLSYNDKSNILRNSRKLKGSSIFINEDLCEASQTKRREQLPQLKQARSEGKIAYFVHTRLVIKDRLANDISVTTSANDTQFVPENTDREFPNLPGSSGRGRKLRSTAR